MLSISIQRRYQCPTLCSLNFAGKKLDRAVQYAWPQQEKFMFSLNTFVLPMASSVGLTPWQRSLKDKMIIAIPLYLSTLQMKYPDLKLHLSVQASANRMPPQVIDFPTAKNFNANVSYRRACYQFIRLNSFLVTSLDACWPWSIQAVVCASWRKAVATSSSYMTGESPNTVGACSPAKYVRWQETGTGPESRRTDPLPISMKQVRTLATQHCVKAALKWYRWWNLQALSCTRRAY